MASAYGRGGTKTGGKGGTTLHQAYGFGAKDAGSYLTGGLANEYSTQQGLLETGKSKQKKAAKGKIGTLRDIASANAVGEFLDFASTKGRGSMASAGKGLIAGKTYAGGTEGAEATSFNPGGALSYAGAMGGDPRGQLHSSFNQLKSGDTSVESAFGFDQPKVEKHRRTGMGPMGMKALMDRKYGKHRYLGESQGKIADPASVLYGGEGAYQQGRIQDEHDKTMKSRYGR